MPRRSEQTDFDWIVGEAERRLPGELDELGRMAGQPFNRTPPKQVEQGMYQAIAQDPTFQTKPARDAYNAIVTDLYLEEMRAGATRRRRR